MTNPTLDMDTSTSSADDSISYNLTPDGANWPNNGSTAKQFSISATVESGDEIKVTIPKGIKVQTYDTPKGATVKENTTSDGTELDYTFSTSAVVSFNISYFFSLQGDNEQFAPGKTSIPITVETGSSTLKGTIEVNNPINSELSALTHNTAVSMILTPQMVLPFTISLSESKPLPTLVNSLIRLPKLNVSEYQAVSMSQRASY